MPKILCTIAGAPTEIGGVDGIVKFSATDAGLVSEDIGAEAAAYFASIPGYSLVAEEKQADVAELEALRARAAAANVAVDSRWKIARLRNEVEHAEKAAADQAPK